MIFIILFLAAFEQLLRVIITTYFSDYHPVMELERHRHILARHIAVDGFSCAFVACVGYQNRHALKHLLTLKREQDDKCHERVFGYQPAGHYVLLYFFSYQMKNMYDTIVWKDGIVFVLHHILAGGAAWLGMYPGVAGLYAIFFMGISEISTSILCLLANFDPDLGIVGLEEAFPNTRLVLASIFVVTFIICRIILWPLFSWHFLQDALKVWKTVGKNDKEKKFAIQFIATSCVGLSFLQVIWLGEIVLIGREEVYKLLE